MIDEKHDLELPVFAGFLAALLSYCGGRYLYFRNAAVAVRKMKNGAIDVDVVLNDKQAFTLHISRTASEPIV